MYTFSDALIEEYLPEAYTSNFLGLASVPLQKQFLNQVKQGVLDITLFHQAYDALLNGEGLFKLFSDDGLLLHKGTYGDIKKLSDPNLPPLTVKTNAVLAKGLKALWVAQFKDNLKPTNLITTGKPPAPKLSASAKYTEIMQRPDIQALPVNPNICVFYNSATNVYSWFFISNKKEEIKFISNSDGSNDFVDKQAVLVGVSLPIGDSWSYGVSQFYNCVSYTDSIPDTILKKLGWIFNNDPEAVTTWIPVSRNVARLNNAGKFRAEMRAEGWFDKLDFPSGVAYKPKPRYFIFDPVFDSWAYQISILR